MLFKEGRKINDIKQKKKNHRARKIHVNVISMHVAEKGQGPLVLLIHGFPELWSSWTHQINHLAAGCWLHMVTMSSHQTCDGMESQTVRRIHLRIPLILHIVDGDLIGLLNELGEDRKEFFRLSILFFLFFALITVIRTRSCSMK